MVAAGRVLQPGRSGREGVELQGRGSIDRDRDAVDDLWFAAFACRQRSRLVCGEALEGAGALTQGCEEGVAELGFGQTRFRRRQPERDHPVRLADGERAERRSIHDAEIVALAPKPSASVRKAVAVSPDSVRVA